MGRFRYLLLALASVFLVAAGGIVTASPASAWSTGWDYIQTGSGVLNASGCGNPANVIQYTLNTGARCSGGGSNEEWAVANTTGGETDVYAYYDQNYMCLGASSYSQGAQVYAYNCDNSNGGVKGYEEWKFECSTNSCMIVPWYSQGYCLNVAGGNGNGNNVVLWNSCPPGYYANEQFKPYPW